MAFDQSKAFTQLEEIVARGQYEDFIYDFLLAFKMPRATITKLRKNIGSDVFSSDGEIRLKNRIHFRSVEEGEDLHGLCKQISSLPGTTKDKIRFIFITDFNDVLAYDTKVKDLMDIEFVDLHKSYAFFLPLAGIEKYELTDEHPADIKASYKMGQLCDVLRRHNDITTPERVHAFNVFLTRLLFCFYAEDTGIFKDNQIVQTIQNTTDKNGSDLSRFFSQLFAVLNLADRDVVRSALPSHFSDFPYVNGGLFANSEWVPEFTGKARRMIIEAGSLEWDQINPDIFGSMFQSVIDPEQRGKLGQHYTSVPNIMKVIQPLFLDDLEAALEKSKNSVKKLQTLLVRLQRIRVFDPACGSGNFLIIAYKELRKLEMKILRALDESGEQSVIFMSGIRLNQFYGIEIDDFAHEIALLSLWLTENQMNTVFEAEFGHSEPMLPLKESGNIMKGNSLILNWEDVCPISDGNGAFEVYTCGNPPFLGKQNQSKEQRTLQSNITQGINAGSDLDFVCCWILKAAQYNMTSVNSKSALVATNSIVQGEQVSILWGKIFSYGIKIDFLYEPFIWKNSAQNTAAVHCTIVGFSVNENNRPRYIIGTSIDSKNQYRKVKNISPYLIEGTQTLITKRNAPFGEHAKMVYGNKPTDDGNFILTSKEKDSLIESEPQAEKYIKRFIGAKELLDGLDRWCLWIPKISKHELSDMPIVQSRVNAIALFREKSTAKPTRQSALRPHEFFYNSHPEAPYIAIPETSSERRLYIPIAYLGRDVISSNAIYMIPNAAIFEFAVITSEMHNDWMRTVAGRLESRYRYSASLVYNTFPWPDVNAQQKEQIARLGEEILLVREDYPDKTLAQLYDPDKMPAALFLAHRALDEAIEKSYRDKPFENASERLEFLFKRYEQSVAKESQNA